MRPTYETKDNMAREHAVLETLRQVWHPVVITKLPPKYALDAFADWGTNQALLEVKCRNCASTTYKTYMLSMRKVREGLDHAALIKQGAFLLVVEWTDGLFVCDVGEAIEHWHVDIGGRADRGDSQDIEPVVHIPVNRFHRITVDNSAQLVHNGLTNTEPSHATATLPA